MGRDRPVPARFCVETSGRGHAANPVRVEPDDEPTIAPFRLARRDSGMSEDGATTARPVAPLGRSGRGNLDPLRGSSPRNNSAQNRYSRRGQLAGQCFEPAPNRMAAMVFKRSWQRTRHRLGPGRRHSAQTFRGVVAVCTVTAEERGGAWTLMVAAAGSAWILSNGFRRLLSTRPN